MHGEVARDGAAQRTTGARDLAEQGMAVGDGEGTGAVTKVVDRAGHEHDAAFALGEGFDEGGFLQRGGGAGAGVDAVLLLLLSSG